MSIFFKIAVIILGSIIAAYGITLAIGAGFGGATLAVLWEGVAYTFNITIGTGFICRCFADDSVCFDI